LVAIAPDLLSRQGGVQAFAEPTQQTAACNRTTVEQRRSGMIAALGFCAGGEKVWELAVAVPFYGTPPTVEVRRRMQGPVVAGLLARQ
jgi:dienelactone hydrolase